MYPVCTGAPAHKRLQPTVALRDLVAIDGLVAVVSLIASYIPARRIARLDPTTALRTD